ncbi:TIR domain-containing protein [Specibacter sp. NPDC078709]|uniref:AbiJ-related protein n=1 Tax=Specibacter sp. NPDC078709 TaxID=3154364 RepID=UPI003412E1DF
MPNSISEVTRRKVMDLCTLLPLAWSGRLSEPEFLARIFPLRDLPSTDKRFNDAYGDVTQHRVNNPEDWENDYIFTDPRFNLLWGTDENFLKFIEMTVNPVALSGDDAASLVETYNKILSPDGYKFIQDGSVSGHPLYKVEPFDPWADPQKKVTQNKAEPVTEWPATAWGTPLTAWGTTQEKTEPVDPWADHQKKIEKTPQKKAKPVNAWETLPTKVEPVDPWADHQKHSIRTAGEPVADLLHSPGGSQESISSAVGIPGGVPTTSGIKTSPAEKSIFIVHGHDDTAKTFVHHFLNQLTGRDAVILHEQGNSGQSLIEKLEKAAAQANFAVIILTADDLGKAKDDKDLEPRGRQNVVFEMGYFMAHLGRDKVAILQATDVTEPGDVRGMLYIPFNSFTNDWKGKLAGELEDAGIQVNLRVLTK